MFDFIIYPLFNRCNLLTTPLQRMGTGMMLASMSYVVAGGLQLYITSQSVHFPNTGQSALTLASGIPHDCNLSVTWLPGSPPSVMTNSQELHRAIVASNVYHFHVKPGGKHCKLKPTVFKHQLMSSTSYTLFFHSLDGHNISEHFYVTAHAKPKNGLADVRFTKLLPSSMMGDNISVHVYDNYNKEVFHGQLNDNQSHYQLLHPKIRYNVKMVESMHGNSSTILHYQLKLDNGAAYTQILMHGDTGYYNHRLVDLPGNKVNMLWQVPQYVIIEAGEILISVTGLAFA
uniref:Uncharacterized protein n=1 Tax=Ciona savignyi TaxID=51511 RepID=H2YKW6_CIOSA